MKNYKSLFYFQLTRLFRTWTSWFIIFGPFGLLLLTAFVNPPQSLMYLIMGIGISTSCFFQFGNTYRSWKQNEIIQYNMKFFNIRHTQVLISFIVFSVIMNILGILMFLLLSFLTFHVIGFQDNPFFTTEWAGYDWGFISYISCISITLSLGVAYFLESLTKKSSTYSTFATLYIVLILFAGGFMNTTSENLNNSLNESNIKWIQLMLPHWYINKFVLDFFVNGVDMSTALTLTNNTFHNVSIIMPWIWSIVLFGSGIYINNRRFNFA